VHHEVIGERLDADDPLAWHVGEQLGPVGRRAPGAVITRKSSAEVGEDDEPVAQ
jgi:hypothetical protein